MHNFKTTYRPNLIPTSHLYQPPLDLVAQPLHAFPHNLDLILDGPRWGAVQTTSYNHQITIIHYMDKTHLAYSASSP